MGRRIPPVKIFLRILYVIIFFLKRVGYGIMTFLKMSKNHCFWTLKRTDFQKSFILEETPVDFSILNL